MEREPERLQLRYATSRSEHIDDVLVTEDEDAVVVYATVCTPVVNLERHLMEAPYHVYLERPLGGRKVFDGVTGREVPYKNVWDEMRRDGLLDDDWGGGRGAGLELLDPPDDPGYDEAPGAV